MYFEKSILFEDGIYLFNTFPEDDTWSDTIREVNISVTYGQETDDYQMFYSNLDADIYVEYVLDSTIITFCEVPFCNYQSLESEFNLSGRLVIFE
ncbi:MAG: hypothetical protein C0596_11625 [Marinilabiliales bacterium]|nr:MAG: hypothetical protein C0596_11625 [Marinilabiliales bacterium]